MAVTFTPNIGLAKPTKTEVAKNWVAATTLAAANNGIIVAKTNIPITTYTPTIIGPTTNPNVGAGVAYGEYYEIQGYIFGLVSFGFLDPGVAVGSGTGAYGLSLPVLADAAFHTIGTTLNDTPGIASVIGEGYSRDESSIPFSGSAAIDIVAIAGVHYARLLTEAYTGKTIRFWGPGAPANVATLDQVSANFIYKKA